MIALVIVGLLCSGKCFAVIGNSSGQLQISRNAQTPGEHFVESSSTKDPLKVPLHATCSFTHECSELMSKFNLSDDLMRAPTQQCDTVFFVGMVPLSFVDISSIIEDVEKCKVKGVSVTCALQTNLTNILRTKGGILSAHLFPNEIKRERAHIKALSLSNNYIQSFHNNAFDYFNSLEVLDLSANNISEVDLTSATLNNLTKLRISRNRLQDVKSHSSEVRFLYLDNNELSDVTFLSTFPNLTIVNISNNRIASVPPHIFKNLTMLICLVLKHNKITDISFLPYVSKSTILGIFLSNNKIREVNTDLTEHTKLQHLEFNDNEIRIFNFSSFKNRILHLNICNNNISVDSPKGLLGSKLIKSQLKTLIVCNNSFTTANFLLFCDELRFLDLSGNAFVDISIVMEKLTLKELGTLRVKNVNLHSLEFVKNLTNLKKLDADHNKLKTLPKVLFSSSRNLEELRLLDNPLDALYCPYSKEGNTILNDCKISYGNSANKMVLDLGKNNKEVNNYMECIFNVSKREKGKHFLYSCDTNATLALKGLSRFLVVAITLLLKCLWLI